MSMINILDRIRLALDMFNAAKNADHLVSAIITIHEGEIHLTALGINMKPGFVDMFKSDMREYIKQNMC